ncbi:dihydrodipicolinate synthase family protein [Tessaracoccus sp. G1721]
MTHPLVITAAVTAFTDTGALDLESSRRIFAHAIDGGVDALFVNGTTGEFPALSVPERRLLLETALEVCAPERIVAHVGAASPHEVALLTADALELGVQQLSVLTPFYLAADLDGVRRQITAAQALSAEARIFLYLFPDRTGVQMAPAQAAALIEEFDLAGAKISIAGTDYLRDLVAALGSKRTVLSGNDGLLPQVLAAGGDGIVSGVSSAIPGPFVAQAAAIAAGDAEAERAAAADVARLVPILGPSIAALKVALVQQGVIDSAYCRMAIPAPDDAFIARIASAISPPQDPSRVA